MAAPAPCITLTDNGSLRPEATFSLRSLAGKLSEKTGREVHPVSLLHSDRIAPAKLEGVPADTLEKFFLSRRPAGENHFLVVPLFFGPSAAIAEYLPQRVDALREEAGWAELVVRCAPCLVDPSQTDDIRVASMLADLVRETHRAIHRDGHGRRTLGVALVDHGTPRRAVTEVRNFLADQLRKLLEDLDAVVRPCSMERRESADYDFNEPLLERLLGQPGFGEDVIVSMLFLQPGRHAGPGGDVAGICERAEQSFSDLKTHRTELMGSHPALIELLAERLERGLDSEPLSWKAMMIRE